MRKSFKVTGSAVIRFSIPVALYLGLGAALYDQEYLAPQAWCLEEARLNEAGNQSRLGQDLIDQVVLGRASENRVVMWGGDTPCKIVTHRVSRQQEDGSWKTTYQFSYLDPTVQKKILQPTDTQVAAAKWRLILGVSVPRKYRLARYYINERHSTPKNVCRFRASYVSLGKEQDHEFFRDSSKEERKELWAKLSGVCKRLLRQVLAGR